MGGRRGFGRFLCGSLGCCRSSGRFCGSRDFHRRLHFLPGRGFDSNMGRRCRFWRRWRRNRCRGCGFDYRSWRRRNRGGNGRRRSRRNGLRYRGGLGLRWRNGGRPGWQFRCLGRRRGCSGRLDYRDRHRGNHGHSGTRGCYRSGGSLGHDRCGRRLGGNRRRGRRYRHNRRRLANRRHDLPRLGTRWRRGRMRHRHHRRGRPGWSLLRRRSDSWFHRSMAPPRRHFVFLLLCEDRLQRISGLGDMRQVDLWL
jgi:hypothetical protein